MRIDFIVQNIFNAIFDCVWKLKYVAVEQIPFFLRIKVLGCVSIHKTDLRVVSIKKNLQLRLVADLDIHEFHTS